MSDAAHWALLMVFSLTPCRTLGLGPPESPPSSDSDHQVVIVIVGGGGGETDWQDCGGEGHWTRELDDGEVVVWNIVAVATEAWMIYPLAISKH